MTIEKVIDAIKKEAENLEERCRRLNMTDKVIGKFLNNEEIKICYNCQTYNMYELSYNKKEDWSMYKCDNCNKTYLINWKDEQSN